MTKATVLCAALALSSVVALRSETVPLQFKTIPADQVLHFPGGYGLSFSLSATPPSELKNEPKAVSRHPVYGQYRLAAGGGTLLLRLDESQGDGKGYDQLLLDVNQNGDLTDDTAAPRASSTQERPEVNRVLFGPIQGPASKRLGTNAPVLYAQVYLYSLPRSSGRSILPSGIVQLKAGWYLEGTVAVDGAQHKVGVYDANSNFRLGEAPQTLGSRDGEPSANWGFSRADVWLVDANGSGSFEDDVLQSEAAPFGSLLYVGGKPFKVALAEDGFNVNVEPWSEPLAEVTLEPNNGHVHDVTLAWERQGGQWQQIRPTVAGGKFQVPQGNYRLFGCNLLTKSSAGEPLAALGYERSARMPRTFVAGKANLLPCGEPLQVKVTAVRAAGGGGVFQLFESSNTEAKGALRISAEVLGAEGEVYSAFLTGTKLDTRPAKPTFSILDAEGKEVAHGNLEYG